MDKYYKDTPDGIPGNEDCGTMSAWAIFSMMGFYPDSPGSPTYTLTAPVFDRITLHLDKRYYPNGDLVIEVNRATEQAARIQRMTLGGKPLRQYRIAHQDLMKGGKLVFDLQ